MLFEFLLRPLEEVQPWGDDEPTLHWFGLTDGWCWWNVGSQQLHDYPQIATSLPYIDYQVVRPWEDLILRINDLQEWNLFQDTALSWMEEQDTDEA